jgi:hypothetical protein
VFCVTVCHDLFKMSKACLTVFRGFRVKPTFWTSARFTVLRLSRFPALDFDMYAYLYVWLPLHLARASSWVWDGNGGKWHGACGKWRVNPCGRSESVW